MRLRGHEQGLRWLLLCLLLLGVVSMHHFMPPAAHDQPSAAMVAPGAHGADPMQQPHSPAPAPDQGHDLLHLCMAVLGAVAGLLLIVLLLTTSWLARTLPPRRPPVNRRAGRPPDLSGRTLLSSVCVLRL
jgi:hypothetical protein